MTILLTQLPDNFEADVRNKLLTKFGIDKAHFNLKLIHQLPYSDLGYEIFHLPQPVVTDYWGIKDAGIVRVEDCCDVDTIAEVVASQYIEPVVYFCDELEVAKRWLARYDADFHTVAVDFESRDLTLPHFNKLSMLSIGWNLLKSTVIVFANEDIEKYVLNWLVTTNVKQVWHNSVFDLKFVKYHTSKLPKYIDDSQLLAAVYNNNVDSFKRVSGLKQIAGTLYRDWANDKSSFELYDTSMNSTVTNLHYVGEGNKDIYNLALIKYAGIDTMATKFSWEKYAFEEPTPNHWIMPTSEPRDNTEGFNQRYYYEFILKPAIPVIVEMIMNGQAIDLSKVDKLKAEVEAFNAETLATISAMPMVKKFQDRVDNIRIEKFLEPVLKAMKQPKYEGYKNNVAMRTWIINTYCGTEHEKVSAAMLKDINHPIAELLHNKDFEHPSIKSAADAYEIAECLRQNTAANRIDKIQHPEKYIQIGFNPWNYQQLKQMWLEFGLESYKVSKETGEMSFDSKVLEELAKTASGEPRQVIKLYLEVAQSKNMITQYIPKYYGSTVNGRLHYSLRLFGTFTGRLSGKAGDEKMEAPMKHQMGANGVTQPVGHKVYGKTVKSMFVAPPGRIMAAVDYNGLENHINACLTKDATTIKLLSPDPETGLMWDMHTLHSTIFFKEQWEELTGKPFENTIHYNKMCYDLTEIEPKAKRVRNDSKPITFKLAYGGFPDDHKGGTITQAIFDRYHKELYPGVTKFREDYVIPASNEQKFLHLNWGLKLYSSNPKSDLLSMNNANFQGYSCLTLIAAIKFRDLYLSQGNPHNILGLNIIHDALYYELDDTPEAVKWVNDNLIACMVPDFLHNQTVHLRAEADFGYDQSSLKTLRNNASIDEVKELLNELRV